jgi:hypothetical protein
MILNINIDYFIEFRIFTAVSMDTRLIHHALMIEDTNITETSVNYQTTQRHNPEDSHRPGFYYIKINSGHNLNPVFLS